MQKCLERDAKAGRAVMFETLLRDLIQGAGTITGASTGKKKKKRKR